MGFFSDIFDTVKDVFGGVGDVIGDVLSPVSKIGDAVSGFGGIASGVADYFGSQQQQENSQEFAREQMAFQRDMANAQMGFQERMSNSAFQRSMQDMKAGGLNPILAYKMGGASSPAGASGSGAMGVAQNVLGNAVRTGVSTGMQAKRLDQELDVMNAQEKNINQDTDKKYSEYRLNDELHRRTQAETTLRQAEEENVRKTGAILDENLSSAKAAAAGAQHVEKLFNTDIGKWLKMLGAGARELNPFLDSAHSARNLGGR